MKWRRSRNCRPCWAQSLCKFLNEFPTYGSPKHSSSTRPTIPEGPAVTATLNSIYVPIILLPPSTNPPCQGPKQCPNQIERMEEVQSHLPEKGIKKIKPLKTSLFYFCQPTELSKMGLCIIRKGVARLGTNSNVGLSNEKENGTEQKNHQCLIREQILKTIRLYQMAWPILDFRLLFGQFNNEIFSTIMIWSAHFLGISI